MSSLPPSARRGRARLRALLPAPLLLLATPALARQSPLPEHVDPARCADCHPGEVASWLETGMARALDPLAPGELEGLDAVVEEGTGLAYRLEEPPGGAPRLVERLDAVDPPHEADWPLAFAIGAGDLDRSYVVRDHGYLRFAPVERVTERADDGSAGAHRAALAPFESVDPGTRLAFPITPECLACHTESPPPLDWPLDLEPEGWQPRGISCGACHAGTAAHAEWREAALAGEATDGPDPLLAPAAMTREERLSVCAACHLQGDARVQLEPRRMAIPRPGGDLLDHCAVFVAREPGAEVGFVSQVERLVLSRCYTATAGAPGGGLSCETCHDPHRSVYDPVERARVRAACLDCHASGTGSASAPGGMTAPACTREEAAADAGRDCASCHMPETPTFDVAGVRIHDHWIRRRPVVAAPPDVLRFPESAEGDWRRFTWPGVPPPATAGDPGLLAMALASRGHEQEALDLLAREKPGTAAVRLPMFHHVRGSLLERADRLPDAERAYRVALALDPDLAATRTNLGLLLSRLGKAEEGLAMLDALIAAHPRAEGAVRNRAIVHAVLGQEDAFVADLQRAFSLLPSAAVARVLARHYTRAGNPDAASHWQSEARRLDPLSR